MNHSKRHHTDTMDEHAITKYIDHKKMKDVESQIVEYVLARANYGHRKNINTTGPRRKILMMGRPYYWDNTPIDLSSLPDYFNEFAKRHGVEDCNSILCNVYLENQSKIGSHCDNTSLLKPNKGTVKSISLAIHHRDREKRLAQMLFSDGTTHDLYHGTCVEFDAFSDFRNGRKHEVKCTEHPRLNLTYRHLK